MDNEIITLTDSSWVSINKLPNDILQYTIDNFDKMFEHKPASRAKVVMYGTEVNCNRWQQSYLNTPTNILEKTSYMFSGKELNVCPVLPTEFQTIFDYVNKGLPKEKQYNQVTVNWYAADSDYIAYHSDYDIGRNSDILVVNLVKNEDVLRTFCIKPKKSTTGMAKKVKIPLYNGAMITMHGNMQQEYKHGVPKTNSLSKGGPSNIAGPRISLSFRSYLY